MYRQTEKNFLSSNTSSTCPDNMVNFDPLTAEIGSGVWGTPTNFNWFLILASLLHRRHSLEANQTLHTFGRLLGWYTIYIIFFGAWNGTLPSAKFTLRPKSCVLLYWQRYHTALKQWASAKIEACYTRNGITKLSQRAPSTLCPQKIAPDHVLQKLSSS